jgi:hypothetical protein
MKCNSVIGRERHYFTYCMCMTDYLGTTCLTQIIIVAKIPTVIHQQMATLQAVSAGRDTNCADANVKLRTYIVAVWPSTT